MSELPAFVQEAEEKPLATGRKNRSPRRMERTQSKPSGLAKKTSTPVTVSREANDHSYSGRGEREELTSTSQLETEENTEGASYVISPDGSIRVIVLPTVGHNIEIKSSVQEEGDEYLDGVKPQLSELAVARGAYRVAQPLDSSGDEDDVDGRGDAGSSQVYRQGQMDINLILGLIYRLPISDVPYNVSHEELVKALSTPNDRVSVRTMRRTLPCLRIVAYMKAAEYLGKKKIKGLWNQKPHDWPKDSPYKDPNNGEKVEGVPVPKATSSELRLMFWFLKTKFMTNIKNEIDHMTEEERREVRPLLGNALRNGNEASPATNKSQNGVAHARRAAKRSASYSTTDMQSPASAASNLDSPPPASSAEAYGTQAHSYELPLVVQDEVCVGYPQPAGSGDEEYEEMQDESDSRLQHVVYLANSTEKFVLVDSNLAEFRQSQSRGGEGTPLVSLDEQGRVKTEVLAPEDGAQEMTRQTHAHARISMASSSGSATPGSTSVTSPGVKPSVKLPKLPSDSKNQLKRQELQKPVQRQASEASQSEDQKIVIQPSYDSSSAFAGLQSCDYNRPVYIPSGGSDDHVRNRLLDERFQRLKEKIMYLQNLTLGDVDTSAILSGLFSKVIQPLYSKARMDPRQTMSMLEASSNCEYLIDRVMLEGKKIFRGDFLRECQELIEKYGEKKEPDHQNLTVLAMQARDPRSSGASLRERMSELSVHSQSQRPEPEPSLPAEGADHLGIRLKKRLNSALAVVNLIENRDEPQQSEDKEKAGGGDEKKSCETMQALDEQILEAVLKQSWIELMDTSDVATDPQLGETMKMLISLHDPMWCTKEKDAPSSTLDGLLEEVADLKNETEARTRSDAQPLNENQIEALLSPLVSDGPQVEAPAEHYQLHDQATCSLDGSYASYPYEAANVVYQQESASTMYQPEEEVYTQQQPVANNFAQNNVVTHVENNQATVENDDANGGHFAWFRTTPNVETPSNNQIRSQHDLAAEVARNLARPHQASSNSSWNQSPAFTVSHAGLNLQPSSQSDASFSSSSSTAAYYGQLEGGFIPIGTQRFPTGTQVFPTGNQTGNGTASVAVSELQIPSVVESFAMDVDEFDNT